MMRYLGQLQFIALLLLCCCSSHLAGNSHRKAEAPFVAPLNNDIRVEPANWWTGMKHNRVELMVHRKDISGYSVALGGARGVKLVSTEKAESPNYLFVTIEISPKAKPQTVALVFSRGTEKFAHPFPILERTPETKAQGVGPRDVVYLVFPDRFSNGDPSNDNIPGMRQGLQRDSLVGRHGGDLQGIINHLDYIKDLGITAIWLNPELENDQKRESYHGYAVTDHYRVDRRFGSNELLKELVKKCHEKGIKVVRDVVLNHIGSEHWWMEDLPSRDWLNQWPVMTQTTYRAPTLLDPYASEWDKKRFSDGWFVPTMPDLNQRNPHLANYLIQQAIWWMEFAGLDDFRIDTYTYSDQAFCSRWCREVREEYPNLNMFGEVWEHGVSVQGYFGDNQPTRTGFDSNLPSLVDFQLCFAIHEALSREQGWTEGISRVYYTLAKDNFYEDPFRNVIMLDNHDFSRFYTIVREDFNKYKSGMAFLLTTRGIPQIYYMTEILGTGNEWPSHGNIRKDFPGGWPGDPADKFTAAGRTEQENEAFNYARTLIRYRNETPALHRGKLTQFVPVDGVYVYFRSDESKTVMVVLNTANSERTIETLRFEECLKGAKSARDVITGQKIDDISKLVIPANSPLVYEISR